jgi:hypothetical protein
MSNKNHVSIELFNRDSLSLGAENREKYGQAIYHWAILIRPKNLDDVSNCAL